MKTESPILNRSLALVALLFGLGFTARAEAEVVLQWKFDGAKEAGEWQGKVGKAFETLGRLAINSTVGVGGLFDVAGKKADLPYRRNGFANTLGYYGVKPGAYLFLPLIGPTTVRDLVGGAIDGYWDTGNCWMDRAPASMMTMAMTHAKMGRLMKN